MSAHRVSVIVPVFNNNQSLAALHSRLHAATAQEPGAFEFLFVNDGSLDSSAEALHSLAKADDRVRVLELSRNFGSNAAILAGLAHSTGECVIVLAADLQDPPEMIPEMIESWRRGHQVVLAARRSRSDPFVSRLFAQAFNHLFRRLAFPDFPKQGFDFVLLDRQVVDILVRQNERNSHLFGQVMWVGFRRDIIPYDRARRVSGRSGWTTSKKIKYFIDAFTAFSYVPLRVSSISGILLALAGLAYASFLIALWLVKGTHVPGWTSVMVVVLIASGVQLLVLGVLGEYIWRILDDTRNRPPYIVAAATPSLHVPEERVVESDSP